MAKWGEEGLLWDDTERMAKHEQFMNLLFLVVERALPWISHQDNHPTDSIFYKVALCVA
jgi:hypothetical protein